MLFYTLPYVLAAYALRMYVVRFHDALLFALLLLAAALVYAVGGVLLSGTVFVLFTSDPLAFLALLVPALLFSFAFVRYVSGISEYLGHRTYISSEEFVRRGLKMFLVQVVFTALAALSVVFIPYVGPLIAFFLSLIALLAGVSIAVDGAKLLTSIKIALAVLAGRVSDVVEFIVLSFLLLLPLVILDVYGGFIGWLLSSALLVFFVTPWLVSELALIYLTRYPLVSSALRRLERL